MEYEEFHSISLQREKKQIIINLNEKDIVSHYYIEIKFPIITR